MSTLLSVKASMFSNGPKSPDRRPDQSYSRCEEQPPARAGQRRSGRLQSAWTMLLSFEKIMRFRVLYILSTSTNNPRSAMKRLCMLLLVALTVIPIARTTLGISQVTQELMIDKTFDAPEDGRLEIHVGDADVTVLSGPGNEVHVAVMLYGQNMGRAREHFEKQQFSVAHNGSVIRVTSDRKNSNDWNEKDWRDAAPQIQVRVTTPKEIDATMNISDGDMEITSLKGDIRLKTSYGDIVADDLAGPYLSLHTSDGDIVSSRLNAETIDIQTSYGNLDLDEITTGKLIAHTQDGDIDLSSLKGDLRLKTSYGDITAYNLAGPYLSLHTSDGDIVSSRLNAETIDIQTSYGDLDLDEITTGKLIARIQDGDIQLGRLKGDIRLKTSYGDITAYDLAGPYLSLHTSDGDIVSSRLIAETIDIQTSYGDLDLDEIAAGKLTARTSDGSIELGSLKGSVELEASYGDITVNDLAGPYLSLHTSDGDIASSRLDAETIEIHTSYGDMDLDEITTGKMVARSRDGDIFIAQLHGSGDLRTNYGDIQVNALVGTMSSAHASDGTITLTNVEGDLSVTGSDTDVELQLQAPGKVVVATSSGDIELTIPQDHSADLALRGDDVHVASDINFDGRMDDDYAEGRINGGGNLIKVRTSDGDVVLQTK